MKDTLIKAIKNIFNTLSLVEIIFQHVSNQWEILKRSAVRL